ncbi:hypothetical protein SCLCIDRAFT_34361 [Scleroderma citrinum Foug A]|uniref:CCHC-type domain-containing protein n=1 Tax=Scleroderma citrinum Foug A TaxID=1036808 RepID=A0A0C3D1U0_9AGAM|nr:hypothetical protein SCLCIDRAFT_34361 [Scleroderma citrinum Foug A]
MQTIDARYWECKSKISCQTKNSVTTSSSSNSRGSASSSDSKGKSKEKDNKSKGSENKSKSSSSSSSTSKLTTSNAPSHLGKDGKLTEDECQRCIKEKLCMFCGQPSHMAKDCPKSTSKSAKTKARAARSSTQSGGCINSNCAPKELRLNASALFDPNSLMPSVSIMSLVMPPVSALVDSGSSHCFIDSKFVNKHSLETYSITLLELHLLDSSSNTFVTEATKLNIHFSTGEVTSKTFFVTLLDFSCVLVLGHSWLTHYNPLTGH